VTDPTAAAYWVMAPGAGVIRPEALGPLPTGHVRVRSIASAVSRGTERLVFEGRVPESEWQRMRCPFQAGAFPAPVKYGYAAVGKVEAGPPDLVGKRVFCLHPHQTRFDVPADAVLTVPDAVPSNRATLAANLETAINALWDGNPGVGDRIAVVGGGLVGSLIAILATGVPGASVEVIEPAVARSAVLTELGLSTVPRASATADADLVFHASGDPAGLAAALELAGTEATVVEVSWYGNAPVELLLGQAFHAKRLTVKSSQVGMVPAARRARWSARRRLALALALLSDPLFDRLIGDEVPFEQLPVVMPRLLSAHDGAPGAVVLY
jgi:threonine dehydrogenase-like Zn-dependent dehydrogenase